MDYEPKQPYKEPEPPKVGIRFDDLSLEIFADIVRIYFHTAGGREANYLKLNPRLYELRIKELYDIMRQELDPTKPPEFGQHYGMREGSRLDDHSKLEFSEMTPDRIAQQQPPNTRVIRLNFYENGLGGEAAVQLTQEVDSAITNYLQEKGLAIPLKW